MIHPYGQELTFREHRRSRPKSFLLLSALLLVSGLPAIGAEATPVAGSAKAPQSLPPSSVVGLNARPADPLDVSYIRGQLTIHAANLTLPDIIGRVAGLAGLHIEIPEGVDRGVLPSVEVGPGPARAVLASLLSDMRADYLIQDTDTEPAQLQHVVILARNNKLDAPVNENAPAGPYRNRFGNRAAPPAEPPAPAPDNSASIQRDNADAAAPGLNAPLPSEQPVEAPVPQPPPQNIVPQQPLSTPTSPVPPPASLVPEVMNNQLQQMYQQRMQMIQQDRQAQSTTSH
jgi:hypothetical protein